MSTTTSPILIAGQWRDAAAADMFQAMNPATCAAIPGVYPVSAWSDCDEALAAAVEAAEAMQRLDTSQIASFLEAFAAGIEARNSEVVEMAHQETAYPIAGRLAGAELPRTTNQLRQAATAARDGSWSMPTIDTASGIRSRLAPIGPVAVFGPNNFPLAFGSASGGDFAAAVAAGNPVIAKANTSHPGTTRLFAEIAHAAAQETDMPAATVQLIYRTSHADGERLVADTRLGATGYTGSRSAGLKLKASADAAGKPIYLELSAINPVLILPGALKERSAAIADEFTGSCLMGTGQFCTNPGMVLLLASAETEPFIAAVAEKFSQAPIGTLLSRGVADSLERNVTALTQAGARIVTGGRAGGGTGYSYTNTLLRVDGQQFLAQSEALQTEAFGNASLLVVAADVDEAEAILRRSEGSLTGCIYSHTLGEDDVLYDRLVGCLRPRVGRLINDKMPTGVAVSSAMQHGGPYPATGHPGFTAVGIPASLRRFAVLECYDNVRPHRLPPILRDKNSGKAWRMIDGGWSQGDIGE